ncbi:MAG: hypothetical protein JWL59_2458 [Chthoniobacteraceae bacterium]|nr:hypothetical protein [Chthoniobacteraceae bacterium]
MREKNACPAPAVRLSFELSTRLLFDMNKLFLLALAVVTPNAWAEPPAKIDVSQLPSQARMIDEVIVPVPSEVFGVLDKIGQPHWEEILRRSTGVVKPSGGAEQIALMLGSVIAEGFIAVESQTAEEVKKIGKSVLSLSEGIGVKKAVQRRSQSIIDAADEKDWKKVRRELDGALSDVKDAMIELRSEELSQLVSLGGWLRGTEALSTVVKKNFSKDGAELLHQPVLLDYFDKRVSTMNPRRQTPLVLKVRQGLLEIRQLIGTGEGGELSEKTVQEIEAIAGGLVKAINLKAN